MSSRGYSKLYFHSAWSTYCRQPLILPEFENRIYRYIIRKCKKLSLVPYAIGGTRDHLHLLFSSPPELTLSEIIGKIKGSSSYFVNHELSNGQHFVWQEGYGVFSVGKRGLNEVISRCSG